LEGEEFPERSTETDSIIADVGSEKYTIALTMADRVKTSRRREKISLWEQRKDCQGSFHIKCSNSKREGARYIRNEIGKGVGLTTKNISGALQSEKGEFVGY